MTRQLLTVIFAISVVTLVAVVAAFLIIIEPATVGDVGLIEASLSRPELPTTTTPDPTGAERPINEQRQHPYRSPFVPGFSRIFPPASRFFP